MGCQVATCLEAPGVSLGGSGVSIGGVGSLRVFEMFKASYLFQTIILSIQQLVFGSVRHPKTYPPSKRTNVP